MEEISSHKMIVALKEKFKINPNIQLDNYNIPLSNKAVLLYLKDILLPFSNPGRFLKNNIAYKIAKNSKLDDYLREEKMKDRDCIHAIKTINRPPHGNNFIYSDHGIAPALTTMQGGNRMPFVYEEKNLEMQDDVKYIIRKLCNIECERLMKWPDNWTQYGIMDNEVYEVPTGARYKAIGNGIVSTMPKTIVETILDKDIEYRVFSTFSGVDGSTLAFNTNFKKVAFSEYEPKAIVQHTANILKYHYPLIPNLGDITFLNENDVPDHDIIFISAPCQSFSTAGVRAGLEDTRGTLFYESARIMAHKKPAYFIFENVKGLLSHDNGRTFEIMCEVYSSLGYVLDFELLNAKNFGVPHNRERVFIFGKLR